MLTEEKIGANRDRFRELVLQNIKRQGVETLLSWLDGTDFYTAPASTRFHEAYKGGLCEHSIVVYDKLRLLNEIALPEHKLTDEQVAIVALLHDLCKVAYYKEGTRNQKNEQTGQWEKVPFYTVEDQFPFGHSEKSVWLIERHIRLKPLEAIAIRCHMGFSDDAFKGGAYFIGNAFEMYPAALNLHLADLQATYQKKESE